jgi:DinB family protein
VPTATFSGDMGANTLRVGIAHFLASSEPALVGLVAGPGMRHHEAMTDTAIDPVASPAAYQAEILSWLGDDDPAVVQAATSARLRELIAAAGDGIGIRPQATEWSVLECIGHLVDSELVTSVRVRWILAEDEPDIVGYDQDRWVDGLRHHEDEADDLVALFESLRAANLRLWASRSLAERARVGIHRERGPESYELTTRLQAGHDRFHIAQAERALAAVRR